VKQQQQPAEELGKQQLDVVLQTVDHENSFVQTDGGGQIPRSQDGML
jgi:hypothetical protein